MKVLLQCAFDLGKETDLTILEHQQVGRCGAIHSALAGACILLSGGMARRKGGMGCCEVDVVASQHTGDSKAQNVR